MIVKTMMYVFGALILVAVLSVLIVPKTVTVTREKVLLVSSEAIFPLLNSNKGFQVFNPYKKADPKLSISFSGPDVGVGSAFAFSGKEGKGTQTITAVAPNMSVTTEIDLGAMGKPIQTFRLDPVQRGTKMTWTTTMDFGYNPIGRVMGLFMDNMLGKHYEQGLTMLEQHVTRDNHVAQQ